MSKANIAFSPGCCCKEEKQQIYGPCSGCQDYLNGYTNQNLPGVILSQSPFLHAKETEAPLHSFSLHWELTSHQNIIEQYPQYRCGYWKIVGPCDYDLYDPKDYYTGGLYRPYPQFYGDRKIHGCIDHDGNLVGLPDRIDTLPYYPVAGQDQFLCIATPHVNSNGTVEPCNWPVTPGTSHINNSYDWSVIWNILDYINLARTQPQIWYQSVVQNDSGNTLIFHDPIVSQAVIRYGFPTASHFRQIWANATPVHPLKLNRYLTTVGKEHSYRMIQDNIQRFMTPLEIQQADDYLTTYYKGDWDSGSVPHNANNRCNHMVYAYGNASRDYSNGGHLIPGVNLFYDGAMTVAAFLVCWGVPSEGYRNSLLSPYFNEIGIGAMYESNPLTAVGDVVTTIVLGKRENLPSYL